MVTPSEIKGLFYHLIKSVGGIEAAGAFLGISHQRVSQLQTVSCADMPTLMHVVTLEAVVGQPIVTGALARAAVGGSVTSDPIKEAGDVIIQAPKVFELVRAGADKRQIKAAIIEMRRELDELDDSVGGSAA